MAVRTITLTTSGWTVSTGTIYYDTVSGIFYSDSGLTDEMLKVDPATRDCHRFFGWYDSTGTVQYIDSNGEFTDELRTAAIEATSNITATVLGERCSYKLTLNVNGGSSGNAYLYYSTGCCGLPGGEWYDNDKCEGDPVTWPIKKPVREKQIFNGYHLTTSAASAEEIDKDGNQSGLLTLAMTGDRTICAIWAAPIRISVNASGGSGGTTVFYRDNINLLWYKDDTLSERITSITPHARAGYKNLGVYDSTQYTTRYVDPNGYISTSWSPTAATTIYYKWELVSYRISLNKASGTGGLDAIYLKIGTNPKECYADNDCESEPLTQVEMPTRKLYSLVGYFLTSTSSDKCINRDGTFTAYFNGLESKAYSFIAQWKSVVTISLNANTGTGGTSKIYYSILDDSYYDDDVLTNPTSRVTPPSRYCFTFDGFYENTRYETQYVDSSGNLTEALLSLRPASARTFVAKWTRRCWKISLNDLGGSGGSELLFNGGPESGCYYSDDQLSTRVLSVSVPVRTGYSFAGYYDRTSGGSKYINETGRIVAIVGVSADTNLYARWEANTYTLSFDYAGGSGSTLSKSVTFASALGQLPTPDSRRDAVFHGWYLDGVRITSESVYNVAGNATAVANWRYYFANLVDYFSLASNSKLVLVSSESGTGRHVTNLWNGACEQGSNLLNPVCVFRIKSAGNVTIQLGKAFGSGYMITDLEYMTGADQEPTLTIRGVANEGADAINLYSVTLSVDPDHIAQDPFNAVTIGGGELVEMTSGAKCDPVVPYENDMPCASDVVHGRLFVSGRTNAYFGESSPTIGNSFVDRGVHSSESDVDFTSYSFAAEREI